MRLLALLLVCLTCAGCGAAAASAPPPPPGADRCPGARVQPLARDAAVVRTATLCLLNAQRAAHGLRPLVVDAALDRAASRHARDMAERDYFEHTSPEGVEPWMRITSAGYRAALVGENLAWGEGERSSPARIVDLWMHSPGHRSAILEPRYTQIGLGFAFDAPEHDRPAGLHAAIYVTTFGSAAVTTAR